MSILDKQVISLNEFATVMGGSIMATQGLSFATYQEPFGQLVNAPGATGLVGVAAVAVYIGAREWLAHRMDTIEDAREFPKGLAWELAQEIDGVCAVQEQGAWVVWRGGHPLEVMNHATFATFQKQIATEGGELVKLLTSSGRPVMTRVRNGKLHAEDGPAVVEWDADGNITREAYYLNGSSVQEDDFENLMQARVAASPAMATA